jgi:hypothetical protein
MAWRNRLTPEVLLAAALGAAAILLIALGWQLTFFQDAWAVLLERQPFDAHSFLAPHNEHLIVFQVAVEKLLVEVFGMTTARPEMLFMTVTLLVSAGLLYVYVRRRVGSWLALYAAVALLFLGSAWQILLWPFEMEFTAPMAAGLGMLLALEREDRRGDLLAGVLLVVAIGFGSLGLSFGFAALAAIVVSHRRLGWGRLWIVVVPALLYLAWYAGWGHDAEHHLTLHNILDSPSYTLESIGAALASLFGLSNAPLSGQSGPSVWGPALAVAAIALAAWGQLRRPGVLPSFWPVAAAAFSSWLLAAFNFIPGREATSVRYVYGGVAFVLLLGAELLAAQGFRLGRKALLIGAGITAIAVLPNLAQLKDGYDWLDEQSVLTRADTGAIEIAARTVNPDFTLTPEVAGTPSLINVNARDYLHAAGEHGAAGYSPAELAAAPEIGRHYADVVLSQALPLQATTQAEGYDPDAVAGAGCTAIPPGGAAVPEVPLRTGRNRIVVAPGGEATLAVRRFAQVEYPVPLKGIPGGAVVVLTIPPDKAPAYPWYAHVQAEQEAWVCR